MGADKDKRAYPAFPFGAAVRAKRSVQSSMFKRNSKLQTPKSAGASELACRFSTETVEEPETKSVISVSSVINSCSDVERDFGTVEDAPATDQPSTPNIQRSTFCTFWSHLRDNFGVI